MDSQAHVGPTESTEGQVLTITVSDPKKESEGMNSYVSYKVNTATNREEFSYGQFGVIRRYSDFAWLSDRLARDVPAFAKHARRAAATPDDVLLVARDNAEVLASLEDFVDFHDLRGKAAAPKKKRKGEGDG